LECICFAISTASPTDSTGTVAPVLCPNSHASCKVLPASFLLRLLLLRLLLLVLCWQRHMV
jgi:hypothetical protein